MLNSNNFEVSQKKGGFPIVNLRINKQDWGIDNIYTITDQENHLFEEYPYDSLVLDIVGTPVNPFKILVNYDDTSVTLDERYGITFEDEIHLDALLDDIYFILEELQNTPEEQRITSSAKVVDLLEELDKKEEEDESSGQTEEEQDS